MIRFRNPGSDIRTHLDIIRLLSDTYRGRYFKLEDFAAAVSYQNLMTSYGFTGSTALSRGNAKDGSRNSPNMNVKMYAEIFRMLGWITSYRDTDSYPIVVTELGRQIANCPNPIALYDQCLLGISSPQEIMDVTYTEKVRFFLCVLRTLSELDGVMYKHELCMGPMSVNDIALEEFNNMLERLKETRASYTTYQENWVAFCASLNMKPVSVDNQTRFSKGVMTGCGWIEDCSTSKVYPPKKLKCFQLTDKGRQILRSTLELKDLRLDEFNSYSETEQDSLIRLGYYSLLKRAGFDVASVNGQLNEDYANTAHITEGRELLFSPYQILRRSRVDKALGLTTHYAEASTGQCKSHESIADNKAAPVMLVPQLRNGVNLLEDTLEDDFRAKIVAMNDASYCRKQIVEKLFNSEAHSNQDTFYPLVAALFRILGFECDASRAGDNGSRMDALIKAPGPAIAIEIKSPGEEEYISVKGVKQAVENKVILRARNQYQTDEDTASLVVGYKAPNDRAEVADLIESFYKAFGVYVAVIPFDTLLSLVVTAVLDGTTIEPEQFYMLKGIVQPA